MGKHAQYVKRGSSTGTGFLPAPLDTDWALGTINDDDALATLLTTYPAGVDQWGVLTITNSTNVPQSIIVGNANPKLVTPLLPTTQYRSLIAWFKNPGNVQVSAWSAPKVFTTLT